MGKNNILDIANRWRDIWKPGSHPEGDGIKLHTIIEESMKVENVRKAHRDVYKKSETRPIEPSQKPRVKSFS